MVDECLRETTGGTKIDIIVSTGAKQDEISGVDTWRKRLIVKVRERPLEGKANESILHLMSDIFSLPISKIKIGRGSKSGLKTLEVEKDFNEVKRILERLIKEASED